jgi:hypothetical protein
LSPGQALGLYMLRADQLAVDVPVGRVSHDIRGVELDPILQPHPISLPITDQDLIHKSVVQALPAHALEGFFDLVGEHLRPTCRVVHPANVVIDEHGGCQDGRGFVGGGVAVGGAQLSKKWMISGV